MGLFSGIGKVLGGGFKTASSLLTGGLEGGLDTLGGIFSAEDAYKRQKEGAKQQNVWAQEAAQRQMDFQKEAYQNRYNWQMEDMRQAGLNPLLAYQTGAGGSPAGASYSPVNVEAGALPAAQSAAAQAKISAEQRVMASTIRRINQDVKTGKAQERNLGTDTFLKNQKAHESMDQAHLLRQTADKVMEERRIIRENLSSAKASAAVAKHDEAFFNTDFGKLMRDIDRIGTSINPFASSAKSARGAAK